jgi:uncharacterized damage-inducible protein DinB
MSDPVLVQLFRHKAWCNERLIEALRAARAEVDRRQMAVVLYTFDHTSRVDRIFKAHLEGEAPLLTSSVAEARPELEALALTLAETDAWYLDYVRDITPAELESVVDFTFMDDGAAGRMTKGEMLGHVITHGASHRGAIGKMLEGLNVAGAPDMVTTFVADDAAGARRK